MQRSGAGLALAPTGVTGMVGIAPLPSQMMQTGTTPGGKHRENHIQTRGYPSGFYNE